MPRSVWLIVLFITAINFFNIIDFMIVMPMGPDYALAFGAPMENVPFVGASYILAASLTAFFSARFLDRFERRRLLAGVLFGLSISEALATLSWSFEALLGFRALAGVFGGLATSLGMAVLAEVVPGHYRGRAMGFVGSAFALSSIIGVPLGLYLALWGGWRAPFWALAAIMLMMSALALRFLPKTPPIPAQPWPGTVKFISRPKTLMAYGLLASVSGGSFLLIPSFATFMQFNLDFPRERMSEVYFVAGLATLIAQQLAGWSADKWSLTATSWIGFGLITISLVGGFIFDPPLISLWIFFPLFMVSGAVRISAANTASSLVPEAHERSAHMALQTSLRHACSGTAGVVSAFVLTTGADGHLQNVGWLALITLAVALLQPILMQKLEPQLSRSS